ncbi:hypothetical protein ROLI_041120 [Roseobacter fucihabitans]|uniref:EF-hand domain-containing protein n=1 Tax=Roseobacter fucihabitans TaxID=1537242 RepID=A0ABZ2C0E4_9RHOB|nr:EF-hand domain-containing protein [Roseobacter litoralis]MBC6965108.1 EF hand [Roseobacter litoralis]MBC6965889.1 EF hand [Roseobacter litoralis]
MKTRKILPIGFLALTLLGSGAMTATAQNKVPAEDIATAQSERSEYRKVKDGHHGKRRGGKRGEMMRTLFSAADGDGDGALTQGEIDSYRAAKLSQADASGDGALSIAEFDTLYREITRTRMVDVFQDFDADGDGQISTQEMDARFGNVVQRMDRDDDGVLTLKERGRRG